MDLEDRWQGARLRLPNGDEIEVDIHLCSTVHPNGMNDGDMTISIYPVTERGTTDTKDSMLSVTISDNLFSAVE
tara:strand:+ start:233 stop:454 length:222 start_codon:yes stop_codon:yes gene_type:complete